MRLLSVATIPLLILSPLNAWADLLAYYPFDEGFLDVSGNGNDLAAASGTPSITAAAGEFVVGGGALDIDSTTGSQEYLNFAVPISFGAGDPWSVVFWARHRPGNDGRTGMIVGDLTNTDFIWIPRDGAVDGIRFRNSSGQNADYNTPPAGVEPAGAYHHFAVVADGTGRVEIYYDNTSLGTRSIATTFAITSVAQAFNQTTQSMNGQIDELHIFDEAITAAKVDELFSGSDDPDTTPPTISGGDFADDRGGGPVEAHSVVGYTLTFSEDMDSATVSPDDFENAGSAQIDIGSIAEITPGVFTIPVTPTGTGTLQLQIAAFAEMGDPAGNALDTTSAIADETVIVVAEGIQPPVIRKLRVYLIGGQSNADGRGAPSGLPTAPVNLQQPQRDVDYFYGSTLTTLRPLSQFGPEITLGRRLADSFAGQEDTRVAIVKYAVGGTSLTADWRAGGDATTSGDGPRYLTFQQVATNGLAALASAYPEAEIELGGMVWVQGERDARNLDHGEYAVNLARFIADVRSTYHADLPFVIVRLSSGQTNLPAEGLDGVRAAQAAVAEADPSAPLVDSDSFGLLSDALHFDTIGQQQIGDAAAMLLLDPLPFLSPPAIELPSGGELRISVANTFPGFRYTLQANPDLHLGGWSDLEVVEATGNTVQFTQQQTVNELRMFFRVRRSMRP